MAARLDLLLAPRAVAIVGASERNHHGKQAADALERVQYAGPVYFINPARKEVWGKPCHPDLNSTPVVADLAILVVNRERVLEVVEQCAEAGVKALVINTDGFGESADSLGRSLQEQLLALVRRHDLLLVGPNCLGVINFHGKAAGYCGPVREPVGAGNVSFISQSGGNTALFIELAYARNLGLSYLISSGNEAHLDTCDFLEHIIEDPNTSVICLLMESIRDPRRFLALSTRATGMGKPVIAVKIGRSPGAQKAAIAHTGALAGSDDAVNALFEQAGVLRATTLDEAIDQCALFSLTPRDRWMKGPRIGVFTVGGGLAGLICDLALDRGFEVPELPVAIKAQVCALLPANVNVQNPFDCPGSYVTDKPEVARTFVEQCAASDEFDAVVMLRAVSGPKSLEYLAGIEAIPETYGKPVYVSATIDSPMDEYKRKFMSNTRLIFVSGLPRLVTGLAAMMRFARLRQTAADPYAAGLALPSLSVSAQHTLAAHAQAGRKVLSHAASYALIDEFGLAVVPQQVVASVSEALEFTARIGYPVVAKLVNSETLTHKTELGAIHVGIRDDVELAKAVKHLLNLRLEQGLIEDGAPIPVLVQKMVQPAMEIFLGATVPAGGFPPMVLVGAGGIYVEVLRDVARHIAPLCLDDARAMIARLKIHPLLNGFRDGVAYDIEALAQAIVRLGDMIVATQDCVGDIDLNPILVGPKGQGALCVDAVMALRTDRE